MVFFFFYQETHTPYYRVPKRFGMQEFLHLKSVNKRKRRKI